MYFNVLEVCFYEKVQNHSLNFDPSALGVDPSGPWGVSYDKVAKINTFFIVILVGVCLVPNLKILKC